MKIYHLYLLPSCRQYCASIPNICQLVVDSGWQVIPFVLFLQVAC